MTKMNARAALARAIAVALITLIVAFGGVIALRRLTAEHERHAAGALVEAARAAIVRGERAEGIVMLERARVIAPRDPSVRSARAEARIADPRSGADRVFRMISPAEWLAVATASAWIASGALAFSALRRRHWASSAVAASGVALFAVAATGVHLWRSSEAAVVASGGATALVAPFASARATAPVAAGTVVVRDSAHGEFVRVRNAKEGVEGWVPSAALVPVIRDRS